ncbi:hypothetical protein E4T80_11215 [Muribacter muris]|uniref:Pectinacetylesterase n=1 Tax=Muribacter muris TaxID=67855 RepID=A0A4Y9JQS9_9PAST|nr:pectin acetylesterase-family hydrolase [Muribacter muris]MBF0786034.1 hypothetical protein [Muribacter muris]MBF0826788.1 hypothetical protein [Muribacter muris]TFV08163.1 hypothetical protein E4T80_11215 [Muribacter muris]
MIKKLFFVFLSFFSIGFANAEWETIISHSENQKCADGTPYEFSYKKGNDNLLIFFNGGGACWDFHSCNSIKKGKYPINTYEESAMLPYNKPTYWQGMLDLNNPNNFSKDWTILNLPYCTADLFIGNKKTTYSFKGEKVKVFHYGKNNIDYAIDWVKKNDNRTFNNKLIIGSSSGGYGAILNFEYIHQKIKSKNTFVFFDAADGVVSKYFEKQIFSKKDNWGYKEKGKHINNYLIKKYNSIISNNKDIIFGSYTTSSDIMQILFLNIMNNHHRNWLNISDKSIKEWKQKSKINQLLLLKNNNYFLYMDNDCIHSGLRYNDSFYSSNNKLIPLSNWFNDFISKNTYSIGLDFLFKEYNFDEKERNRCIFRAVNSVQRDSYEK